MSGVAHAIGKVFKGVVKIVKKVWKPLLIAAAVYFTAGAAAGWFGAAGAVEGAGTAAAVGGAGGVDAAAAIAGGADIGAIGTAGIAGAGSAAAAGGAGAFEAAGGMLAGVEGASYGGAAAGALSGAGAAAGEITSPNVMGEVAQSAYGNINPGTIGVSDIAQAPAATGGIDMAPSSLWSDSLSAAKRYGGGVVAWLGNHQSIASALLQGGSGLLQGYERGQEMNKMLAWQEAHAPGQLSGGGSGAPHFALNQNLEPGQGQQPQAGQVQNVGSAGSPYQPISMPTPYGQGMNSRAAPSYGMPGYGMPGYGVQGNNPYAGLLQQQQAPVMPFMESPYDESATG